jgi:hypothetical protein
MKEIITALEPYKIKVDSIYKSNAKKKIYYHKCYEMSAEYITSLAFGNNVSPENLTLVHGAAQLACIMIGHAWVEIKDTIVFDGVLQSFYTKDGYYKTLKAKKFVSFVPEETRRNLIETEIYANWYPEEFLLAYRDLTGIYVLGSDDNIFVDSKLVERMRQELIIDVNQEPKNLKQYYKYRREYLKKYLSSCS